MVEQPNVRINPAMIKVNIAPVVCYVNGTQMTATQFNVVSVLDNLFNMVKFKYTLYDNHGAWCGEACFDLNGSECYDKWDSSPEDAYNIVADGVGLDIILPKSGSIFEAL